MKPIDAALARQSAERKGFKKKASDHDYYWFHHDGKKTALRIKISHGARELKQREIRADAQACQMASSDMFKVLSCEHDHEWVKEHHLKTETIRRR
jgi:hypothetical protein